MEQACCQLPCPAHFQAEAASRGQTLMLMALAQVVIDKLEGLAHCLACHKSANILQFASSFLPLPRKIRNRDRSLQ